MEMVEEGGRGQRSVSRIGQREGKMKKVKGLFPCCPDAMNDTFSDTGKAFELAQGGSAAFEFQEYLLFGGIVKQLEGATVRKTGGQ